MDVRNYWADLLAPTLREPEAAGRINIGLSSDAFFHQLTPRYPAAGSKIDWSKLPGAMRGVDFGVGNEIAMHLSFVSAVRRRHALAGLAEYAGDGLTEFTIKGELNELIALLPSLLEVPQHHYLASQSGNWCFCFSFEGHSNFGFEQSGAGEAQINS